MLRELNYRGVPLVRGVAEVGERVAYEDMANPRREGVVIDWLDLDLRFGGSRQYQIRWDDGTESVSDCKQYGWTLVSPSEGPLA